MPSLTLELAKFHLMVNALLSRQKKMSWQKNCPDKKIVRTPKNLGQKNHQDKLFLSALAVPLVFFFCPSGSWFFFMSNFCPYTKLAYDSSYIEHWTSCGRIVQMLGCFFVLKMFMTLKHTFSLCRKITLVTLKYFKMHRCFLLMWFFRTSDRWEVNEHMSHDFWKGVAPLLKRCNHIGCTHDSAWGQDYHVLCAYA